LFPHVLKEDRQIGRNAVRTLQILDVFPLVEPLAKLFAHSFDVDHRVRESHIRLTRVLEADRPKHLQLLVFAADVSLFLVLLDLN